MTVRRTLGLAAAWAAASLCAPAWADASFDEEVRLLVRLLDVRSGATVADVGAGEGAYAIALAEAVGPEGRVFATELAAEDREAIARAAREAGADRVVVAEARVDATGLSEASCDAAFLRGVYHHLTDPHALAADLFATVRPGGRLVVVDFPPTFWLAPWTPEGIPGDRGGHGVPPEVVAREMEAAGFRRIETIERWPSAGFFTRDYAIAFERP